MPSFADDNQQEEIALNCNRIKLDKLTPFLTIEFFYARISC